MSRLFSVRICSSLMLIFSKIPTNNCDFDIEEKLFAFSENLLKRMDDSDDNIRLEVLEAFYSYFDCIRHFGLANKRESYFEFIFRCLLIHMDDVAVQESTKSPVPNFTVVEIFLDLNCSPLFL
ncbi:dynein assembly factor 5, axonemal-like [Octopus sinensis]|uniref:Dynein assembly factor 5, axonemal-like n=1 Tax=Octopus sinensis TaxID=2607531 RepID=A0A6P7TYH8_9MOLL|nr:dynein assembly factor 5, axonemal-like [Octopus sinensis]